MTRGEWFPDSSLYRDVYVRDDGSYYLVEFAAQLLSSLKFHRLTSKYILNRTLAEIVPRQNLHRSKHGFAVPIGQWFRGEACEFLLDHLFSSRFAQRGLFRQATVDELVSAHIRGLADYTHHLWILLMLELWHRAFIDEAGS